METLGWIYGGDATVVSSCVDKHVQYRTRGCDELTNAGNSIWHYTDELIR
jgi:hypothetical protein